MKRIDNEKFCLEHLDDIQIIVRIIISQPKYLFFNKLILIFSNLNQKN